MCWQDPGHLVSLLDACVTLRALECEQVGFAVDVHSKRILLFSPGIKLVGVFACRGSMMLDGTHVDLYNTCT